MPHNMTSNDRELPAKLSELLGAQVVSVRDVFLRVSLLGHRLASCSKDRARITFT